MKSKYRSLIVSARYWVNGLIVVLLFFIPTFHVIKFDFLNGKFFVLGEETTWLSTATAFLGLWAGSYVFTLIANYFYGRIFCGWICSWGSPLRTLGYTKDETKQKHLRSYSPYAFTVFASILATTGLLNWFTDLSVLYRPTHSPFLLFLLIFASLTAISTSVLWKVGLRFYQSYCPIGVYLAVTSQKHTMRIDFEPANCTLGEVCIHDCPMALDPRLPAMETENDTHTQCILCVGIALRHATLVLRKYPVRNRCSYERAFSLLKRSILPKYSSA